LSHRKYGLYFANRSCVYTKSRRRYWGRLRQKTQLKESPFSWVWGGKSSNRRPICCGSRFPFSQWIR
jgi:hypothetical protein